MSFILYHTFCRFCALVRVTKCLWQVCGQEMKADLFQQNLQLVRPNRKHGHRGVCMCVILAAHYVHGTVWYLQWGQPQTHSCNSTWVWLCWKHPCVLAILPEKCSQCPQHCQLYRSPQKSMLPRTCGWCQRPPPPWSWNGITARLR